MYDEVIFSRRRLCSLHLGGCAQLLHREVQESQPDRAAAVPFLPDKETIVLLRPARMSRTPGNLDMGSRRATWFLVSPPLLSFSFFSIPLHTPLHAVLLPQYLPQNAFNLFTVPHSSFPASLLAAHFTTTDSSIYLAFAIHCFFLFTHKAISYVCTVVLTAVQPSFSKTKTQRTATTHEAVRRSHSLHLSRLEMVKPATVQ